jgi:dihydrolipoamide dehydrogenase
VIFSHPELASIGLTEKKAIEKFGKDNIETIKINWASNAKARIVGADRGLTKWIIEKHNGKILGCHLLGHSATDLISIVVPIINQNLSIRDMQNWIYPHPTLGEIFSF